MIGARPPEVVVSFCRSLAAVPGEARRGTLIPDRPLRAAVNRDLMEILACPVCKGELTLHVEKETNEVLEGTLHCAHCNHTYEIREGIPNLLPPDFA